jgi:hypothetical protein
MPPVHPLLTSQQSTSCLAMYSRSRLPYSDGGRGRNGAPKQVEKSGWTPTRPFSVRRLWRYSRKEAVHRLRRSELGDRRHHAEGIAVKMTFWLAARPVREARGMNSSG